MRAICFVALSIAVSVIGSTPVLRLSRTKGITLPRLPITLP
jgi:hypothetical protein